MVHMMMMQRAFRPPLSLSPTPCRCGMYQESYMAPTVFTKTLNGTCIVQHH